MSQEQSLIDRLKNAQRGGSMGNAPKLDIAMSLDVKRNAAGKAAFRTWNKEANEGKGENKFSTQPITGIYVGSANVIDAFDGSLGQNGGSYRTGYYFTNNDKVSLFAPGRNGVESVVKGTVVQIKEWLGKNNTPAKVHKVLFVATEKGLYAATTSMVLYIDQFDKIQKGIGEKMIVLTPTLYAPDTNLVSEKTKKNYLKLATGDKAPSFASVTLGFSITEDAMEAFKMDSILNNYLTWMEYKTADTAKGDPAAPIVIAENNFRPATSGETHSEAPGDDLPF